MKTFHLFYEKRRKKANARTHTFFYENTTTKTELKTIHSQLRLLGKKKKKHTRFLLGKQKTAKKHSIQIMEKKKEEKKKRIHAHTLSFMKTKNIVHFVF